MDVRKEKELIFLYKIKKENQDKIFQHLILQSKLINFSHLLLKKNIHDKQVLRKFRKKAKILRTRYYRLKRAKNLAQNLENELKSIYKGQNHKKRSSECRLIKLK